MNDPREEFRQAMLEKFGFAPESVEPTRTRQGHRFSTSERKRGDLAGKYIYHEDGNHGYGWAIDYRTGQVVKFHSSAYRQLPPEERKKHEEALKVRIAETKTADEAAKAKAITLANERWERATNVQAVEDHPYLAAKNVKAFGLRADSRGTLLIPIRNSNGDFVLLQMIFERNGAFFKRFIAGSSVAGNTFTIGPLRDGNDIVLAEGYATAASIFKATGKPVVVCFDCYKLLAAAKNIRQKYPNSRIILAADDDRRRNDGNIGVLKAHEAAKAVDGYAVRPFWPDLKKANENQASDFNDMANLFGDEAVKRNFERRSRPVNRWFPYGTKRAFESHPQKGLYLIEIAEDLNTTDKRTWLCSPLTVDARVVDATTKDWFHLLTFKDHNQETREEIIPDRLLCRKGTELLETLVDKGLRVTTSTEKSLIKDFISVARPEKTITQVRRTGWFEKNFVLPNLTVYRDPNPKREIRYALKNTLYETAGTLQDWQESIARPASGNTRLVFAICVALAGPLLEILHAESGGFSYTSRSSIGKSSAFDLAASVWGPPEKGVQSWNATANAIEALLLMHNDMVLIMDEISSVDAKDGSQVTYMFANRKGKARMNADTSLSDVASWNALMLSNGEKSMKAHAAESGITLNAGQELRLANIDADAGKGMGILDDAHGQKPEAYLSALRTAARRFYGVVGQEWLKYVVAQRDWLEENLSGYIEQTAQRLTEDITDASNQVRRKAMQFALVGMAGYLATEAGITGWEKGEAAAAIGACFQSWLEDFGTADKEREIIITQIRRFLEENKDGRFSPLKEAITLHQKRAGYTQATADGTEYLCYTTTFDTEVCKGLDARIVRQLLAKEGLLRTRTSTNRQTGIPRVHYEVLASPQGEGQQAFYAIKDNIFTATCNPLTTETLH